MYTCVYRLTRLNGDALPALLPNTTLHGGDARDRVTGGFLQLNTTTDGLKAGTGTYEVRYEFEHSPSGSDRWERNVLNDVGRYHTTADGTLTTFESVGKVTYSGNLMSDGMWLAEFPMGTPTFSGNVRLGLAP